LACAVALESLQLFADNQLVAHVEQVSEVLQDEFAKLGSHPHVTNIRGVGMIGALDLLKDRDAGIAYDFTERVGFQVYKEGLKHGLMLRPLGDTVYVWLPLVTTAEQITDIVHRIDRVFTALNL
jgi:adenosylmethionine-8-amino-7-oxononanoate aminotransferase